MDRDAGQSDREDQARRGDTGMIGSEAEEPGPGRDTSLTDPDPVAASTDQPRGTVAMSEGDPMRTRLGSHIEGAGVIGHDVAAAEEGATRQTPTDDRPGYEPERPLGEAAVTPAAAPMAYDRDPDLAGEPGVHDPGPGVGVGDRVDDAGSADRSVVADEPSLAGYEGEPGGAGPPGDEEDRLDRPVSPVEPGVDQGVYDQEADRARRERPPEGL
jgi:hypothetical protein